MRLDDEPCRIPQQRGVEGAENAGNQSCPSSPEAEGKKGRENGSASMHQGLKSKRHRRITAPRQLHAQGKLKRIERCARNRRGDIRKVCKRARLDNPSRQIVIPVGDQGVAEILGYAAVAEEGEEQ